MNLIKFSVFLLSLLFISCSDPNILGLEIQPESDNILIFNTISDDFKIDVQSEDSLRTDNVVSLTLGEIYDPVFGLNSAGFYTQLLLTENNIDLGSNPVVDSVVLSYTYSGYYGDLNQIDKLIIFRFSKPL